MLSDSDRSPVTFLRVLLLCATGLVVWACGAGREGALEIPVPAHLASLEPELVEKIAGARARLEEDPGDGKRWLHLGMIYEAHGFSGLALDSYAGALRSEGSAQAWHRTAIVRATVGRLAEAQAAVERSLTLEPDYAPSHVLLGTYLFDQGRFKEARAAFERATQVDGTHFGGRVGVARVLMQEGDPLGAIDILEAILRERAEEPTSIRLLNTAYRQAGRAREAGRLKLRWYRQADLGPDPWDAEFRRYSKRTPLDRALGALNGGKPEVAVELLEDFVEEHPRELNALSYLAWGYFLTRRQGAAQAAIERALGIDPRNINVLSTQSRILQGQGNARGALGVLEKILAIDANDLEALRRLGRVEMELGNYERAIAYHERFLEMNRNARKVWIALGNCQLELERWDAALGTFVRTTRDFPNSPEGTLGLARAHVGLGRPARAKALLQEAQTLNAAGRLLLQTL